ncbi:MAG: 2-C-methyl-D-erythritol 4-phosphate cytidylyltransferase [Lachnospiraceae bacterium]|nr:2-C-methyl-D-erythritol 4-phosphate cytidylyltransferase [Lachnospiraceae bacterium]
MKSTAIILSAGKGKRMGTTVSKQYLELLGKPIIYYTIKAFEESKVDNIIVVCGKDDIEYINKEIIEKYNLTKISAVTEGGAERYNSVYNGLCEAKQCDIVLIHDGARAFIRPDEINTIIEETVKHDACVAAVKTKDTVKISDENGYIKSTPDRATVWNVQTPQSFNYNIIKEAYENIIGRNGERKGITDDAMVLETYNPDIKIKLVECSYENIKITTPEDMNMGESILTGRL